MIVILDNYFFGLWFVMNWKLYTSHRYKKNISIKKLKIICSLDVKYNKQSVSHLNRMYLNMNRIYM